MFNIKTFIYTKITANRNKCLDFLIHYSLSKVFAEIFALGLSLEVVLIAFTAPVDKHHTIFCRHIERPFLEVSPTPTRLWWL